MPPAGNANYAWIQHFLYHLSPRGIAGFVLAKGSLTSKTSGEGDIRKSLIEARLVDCVVNLPAKLFLNTQIPASLWFLNRNKSRNCIDKILFIDARNEGHLINRRTRELSEEDIQRIADTYHNWRNSVGANGCSPENDYSPLRMKPKSISSFVSGYKSSVTKQINTLRNQPRVSVWQRNYHDHIIRDEKDLNRICEYIVNNPLKWQDDEYYVQNY